MKWLSILTGDPQELSAISNVSLKQSLIKIYKNPQNEYILESSIFSDDDSAEEVYLKAKEIVNSFNGARKLSTGSYPKINVSCVYQEGSNKRLCFLIDPEATAYLTTTSPYEKELGVLQINQWITLSFRNESVKRVLDIVNNVGLNWISIYIILEIIADDVLPDISDKIGGGAPEKVISHKGWASLTEIKCIKQNAQLYRHGKKQNQPSKVLTINEARRLVYPIIQAWFEGKIQAFQENS